MRTFVLFFGLFSRKNLDLSEKDKSDYIQIGKEKIRYKNGLWNIEDNT